jgi:sec-independent protein translocase protein TatB
MLDFDAGKLIVIGIVALVVIPSKDLPRVLRQLGQLTAKARRMAAEFQGQFLEAMREAELHDLKKNLEQEVDSALAGVGRDAAFDPLAAARKEMEKAIEEKPEPPPAKASLAPPLSQDLGPEHGPSA